MKMEKTIFHVVVPLEFDMADFEKLTKGKESKEFRKFFVSDPLRDHPVRPESLREDALILETGENAYMMRFKLAAKQRKAIGLSCEENCIYTHKEKGLSFKIKHVRLWFTCLGIAFLTLEVSGINLSSSDVLDLNAILRRGFEFSNKKEPVVYKNKDGNSVEKNFTFGKMIYSFTELQEDILLERKTDDTYCLFYGMTDEIRDDDDIENYIKTLCQQMESRLKSNKKVEEDDIYEPFQKGHIRWIFSEKVLVTIGELEKGDKEDKKFLRKTFPKTIGNNYVPLYLYYLSIKLLARQLMVKCDGAKKLKSLRERKVVQRQLLFLDDLKKKGKLVNVSKRDFICEPFEKRLCDSTWGLFDSLDKLEKDYLPKFGDCNKWDVFFSYRRKGGFYPALLLYEALKAQGREPFLDLENLASGSFDKNLEATIEKSDAVALILSKGCFDEENRCCDDKDVTDWVREEIKKAVELKKEKDIKIIPIAVDDFKFPEELPDDIYELISKENSIAFRPEMHALEGAMKNLCKLLDE